MYSNQELAEIHFMYGKADGNAALARRLYQERYPQRQCPDRKTFVRLHYRLCECEKFNSPGLGRGRPRSTTPEVQEEILEAVNMTPSISTRRVALQVNVPHTTVWRVINYEAQFTRDGITNFHNQHVWAYKNPRATVPSHHQVRFSLNMWADIIGDRLVGPHVLVNRLTGQAYTNFLENTIPHVLEDTPLINRQHIHFLHDGAPAHFSRTARRYLDRRFPDRWMDRRGAQYTGARPADGVQSRAEQQLQSVKIRIRFEPFTRGSLREEYGACGHPNELNLSFERAPRRRDARRKTTSNLTCVILFYARVLGDSGKCNEVPHAPTAPSIPLDYHSFTPPPPPRVLRTTYLGSCPLPSPLGHNLMDFRPPRCVATVM
ncbi:hypothetical protein ANN_01406 [Periplaneta americana]|uniref:DUF4817 domain-containing protein n=1 Tax=Periplaneta americana TaxID=6978 RepID=A0ABQ8TTK5_PERAM|nr:hypothetical protein ANN_01406 [Periplaneta americana]